MVSDIFAFYITGHFWNFWGSLRTLNFLQISCYCQERLSQWTFFPRIWKRKAKINRREESLEEECWIWKATVYRRVNCWQASGIFDMHIQKPWTSQCKNRPKYIHWNNSWGMLNCRNKILYGNKLLWVMNNYADAWCI